MISFLVVYQKLSREEDSKDQPWGEHSSDESSTEEEDEVRSLCYMFIKNKVWYIANPEF